MAFEQYFGKKLVKNNGEEVDVNSLDGKFVGIYFSAHWCPPCRGFTPQLSEFYKRMKEKRQDFEFVFASSDRDEKAFKEYFDEMPWLALPYSERDKKEALSKKFQVQGIPTFVILGPKGELITKKGREKVATDSEGLEFPWVPKSFEEMLGKSFVTKTPEGISPVSKELKGKYLGLYFSAHWCPPCRGFTPKLSETYKQLKEKGEEFEIVFVSLDREEEKFNEYLSEMPWIAIPYNEEKSRNELSDHFEVESIPTLVILDKDFTVITSEGVGAVSEGAEFPYRPKPLNHLAPHLLSSVNEGPTFIAFTTETDSLYSTLLPLAEGYVADKKDLTFFVSGNDGLGGRIREFASLPSEKEKVMVILDIPSQAKYISEDEITYDNVKTFVEGYLNKTLTSKPIRE